MRQPSTPSIERSRRIARGVDKVCDEAHCTFPSAVRLMNDRAQRSNTSLEIVALAVLAGDLRFEPCSAGYRVAGPTER